MSSALLVGLLLMALAFAHGAFQWLSTDVATTTYTISGLSFQPKAIVFWATGSSGLTDFASQTSAFVRQIGMATGPTDRRVVMTRANDAAGDAITFSVIQEDCCVLNFTTAVDGLLDLDAITSDGFRMIVDDQTPTTRSIFWTAFGGSDITAAATQTIAEPASTGDVDYTVTGFVAGAADQMVMVAGIQNPGAAPSTSATVGSGFCVGFATSGADADNVVVAGHSVDAAATMDTDGYCKTGECLAMIAAAGGNPDARAKLTQFNTNGFRLNWIARGVTGRKYIALAIKGGSWKAGSYTIAGNSASATATVSGLAFQPVGLCLIGRMTAESTAGTSTVQDRMAFGMGSSTTSRGSCSMLDENATATSEIDWAVEFDQVLAFPSITGTLQSAYDINAMNADGFQTIVDTAGGVASEWQGYLTFGSAAAAAANPPRPRVVLQAVHRAASY